MANWNISTNEMTFIIKLSLNSWYSGYCLWVMLKQTTFHRTDKGARNIRLVLFRWGPHNFGSCFRHTELVEVSDVGPPIDYAPFDELRVNKQAAHSTKGEPTSPEAILLQGERQEWVSMSGGWNFTSTGPACHLELHQCLRMLVKSIGSGFMILTLK